MKLKKILHVWIRLKEKDGSLSKNKNDVNEWDGLQWNLRKMNGIKRKQIVLIKIKRIKMYKRD